MDERNHIFKDERWTSNILWCENIRLTNIYFMDKIQSLTLDDRGYWREKERGSFVFILDMIKEVEWLAELTAVVAFMKLYDFVVSLLIQNAQTLK
jgi:hypothetical protein